MKFLALPMGLMDLERSRLRISRLSCDGDEVVVGEGLLDVVEGALVYRLYGRLQRRLRRHEDDRHLGILVPRGGQDVDPSHLGHADVRQHDVGRG
jgi:hypothetical protein